VVRYAVRRLDFATERVCVFNMKGLPGASPETATATRPVRRDSTKKRLIFQPKKFANFDKRGPPGTSPETAAAKSPVRHSAVQETQYAADSDSLRVAICRDDVAITLPR